MNWSTWGNEFMQYFINTSIALTVISLIFFKLSFWQTNRHTQTDTNINAGRKHNLLTEIIKYINYILYASGLDGHKHQERIYRWGAGWAPPPPPVVSRTPLKKTQVFHIWVVNTYYIETTDFRIREKVFKHEYGGSPCNVSLFSIFAQNTC
jgi:hypothetical protein